MTPDVARKHNKRGQLDRSICGACGDAFWECSGCGVYFCDCSRSIEACAPEPRSRPATQVVVGLAPAIWDESRDGYLLTCDGSFICDSAKHVHGCFADRDGTACDDPGDHVTRPVPSTPEEG
jgi:uracil-DNA glycosylase